MAHLVTEAPADPVQPPAGPVVIAVARPIALQAPVPQQTAVALRAVPLPARVALALALPRDRVALRVRLRVRQRGPAVALVGVAVHAAVCRVPHGVAQARAVARAVVLAQPVAAAKPSVRGGARHAAVRRRVALVAQAHEPFRVPVHALLLAALPEPALRACVTRRPREPPVLPVLRAHALRRRLQARPMAAAHAPRRAPRIESRAQRATVRQRVPEVARARAVPGRALVAGAVPGADGAVPDGARGAARGVGESRGALAEARVNPALAVAGAGGATGAPGAQQRAPAPGIAREAGAGPVGVDRGEARAVAAAQATGGATGAELRAVLAIGALGATQLEAGRTAELARLPARAVPAVARAVLARVPPAGHALGIGRALPQARLPRPPHGTRLALWASEVARAQRRVAHALPVQGVALAAPGAREEVPPGALPSACSPPVPRVALADRHGRSGGGAAHPGPGAHRTFGAGPQAREVAVAANPALHTGRARGARPVPLRGRAAVAARMVCVARAHAVAHAARVRGARPVARRAAPRVRAHAAPVAAQAVPALPVPGAHHRAGSARRARAPALRAPVPREARTAVGPAPVPALRRPVARAQPRREAPVVAQPVAAAHGRQRPGGQAHRHLRGARGCAVGAVEGPAALAARRAHPLRAAAARPGAPDAVVARAVAGAHGAGAAGAHRRTPRAEVPREALGAVAAGVPEALVRPLVAAARAGVVAAGAVPPADHPPGQRACHVAPRAYEPVRAAVADRPLPVPGPRRGRARAGAGVPAHPVAAARREALQHPGAGHSAGDAPPPGAARAGAVPRRGVVADPVAGAGGRRPARAGGAAARPGPARPALAGRPDCHALQRHAHRVAVGAVPAAPALRARVPGPAPAARARAPGAQAAPVAGARPRGAHAAAHKLAGPPRVARCAAARPVAGRPVEAAAPRRPPARSGGPRCRRAGNGARGPRVAPGAEADRAAEVARAVAGARRVPRARLAAVGPGVPRVAHARAGAEAAVQTVPVATARGSGTAGALVLAGGAPQPRCTGHADGAGALAGGATGPAVTHTAATVAAAAAATDEAGGPGACDVAGSAGPTLQTRNTAQARPMPRRRPCVAQAPARGGVAGPMTVAQATLREAGARHAAVGPGIPGVTGADGRTGCIAADAAPSTRRTRAAGALDATRGSNVPQAAAGAGLASPITR